MIWQNFNKATNIGNLLRCSHNKGKDSLFRQCNNNKGNDNPTGL